MIMWLPMTLRQGLKRIPGIRRAVCWIRSLSYRFFCPVCNQRVKAFHPLGRFFTDNKKKYGWPYKPEEMETINVAHFSCPHCEAADRYRLYALYLSQRLPTAGSGGARELLEFAPHGVFSRFVRFFPGIRFRTADLFMTGVDDRVDITDMKIYADGRFDVFICSHVLEHVADDRKALAELFRILKPGGWGILMAPINLVAKEIDEDPAVTDVGERWRRFGQDDHVRLYTKTGFIERVKNAGFTLQQYGIDFFGAGIFQRCGITPQSVLYVVEKN